MQARNPVEASTTSIRGADGAELGTERLTYKIQSRGVVYGVETL